MKVTVIIPIYNNEGTIERAINSVLIQEEVDEVILADDGSSDKSLEICIKYKTKDKRIKVFTHKNHINRGVSATRNLGIKNASCEYIAFLDADDYYLPARFKKTKHCFEDPSIDCVYEMIGLVDGSGRLKKYSTIEHVAPENLFQYLSPIGEKIWFSNDGLTVKKNALEKVGEFDEKFKTGEDSFQWLKMSLKLKMVPGEIDTPVSVTEKRPGSLTTYTKHVLKDQKNIPYSLLKWCRKNQCSDAHKELIVRRIVQNAVKMNFKYPFLKFFYFLNVFVRVFLIDTRFIIFYSKNSRLLIGLITGYNRFKRLNKNHDTQAKNHFSDL